VLVAYRGCSTERGDDGGEEDGHCGAGEAHAAGGEGGGGVGCEIHTELGGQK